MEKRRYNLLLLCVFIVIISITFLTQYSTEVEASSLIVNGQLDLSNKELSEEGPFKLNGDWNFYWQKLLEPTDFKQSVPLHSTLINVPSSWSNQLIDDIALPRDGYGTYRLTLRLNEAEQGKLVSLNMHSIATAYRLWVNDELLASNGVVGDSRDKMIPKEYAKIVTFEVNQPEIEILLQVSNFHQRKSGLWGSITFGTLEQITEHRERGIAIQLFVVGCIFIIGFYHLVLFLILRIEYSALFLAFACFGVVVRTLLLKDTLLISMFPQINWEVAVTLEYLGALIALLFFLLFVKQEMAKDISNKLTNFLVSVVIVYSLFVIFTLARIFTNTFLFFQLLASLIMLIIVIVSVISALRKREGAYLNVVAMLVLFIAVLNDVFYYSQMISTDEFVSLGLLFYLFTQSVHLSKRFAHSFTNVEKLSKELQGLNHSLEQKVVKRTEELQEANKSLQKIESARRRLLASVSHELNTPLTFIQGYIKAMIDGVISKDDSTYLRAVYSDTQMMAHSIQDLQELSKLESGQVSFRFESLDMQAFVLQLYEEQKQVVQERGFHFHYKETVFNARSDDKVFCKIDPIRIKQVYINLLTNAQKFTPAGGVISVEVEIPSLSNSKEVKVSIRDTGQGISEKDLPFIFSHFYKVNRTTNEEQRGVGLGLAIAKEIIEFHEGSVGVKSEQGKGSAFFFTIPIQVIKEEV